MRRLPVSTLLMRTLSNPVHLHAGFLAPPDEFIAMVNALLEGRPSRRTGASRRRLVAGTIAVALTALAAPVTATADAPKQDRIYLLASDSEYLYWGVDPSDPELGTRTIVRRCGEFPSWGIPGRSTPCTQALGTDGARTSRLAFMPASLLEEHVTWSAASPLRFHLEGTIDTGGVPYSLSLYVNAGGNIADSPPATEVAPGVWEGTLAAGAPLQTNKVNMFGLRLITQAPVATIELHTSGASYVTLPTAKAVRSVPQLVRDDTYSPQPGSFTTPMRSFTFNDEQWAVQSFTGITGPRRAFDLQIDRHAEIVVAWVELFGTSFVQDIRRGRPPNATKLEQGVAPTLVRDGEVIAHSTIETARAGVGTEGLAFTDLPPGPLSLEVNSADEEGNELPFTAYVLQVHGERTLASIRWQFFELASRRIPVAASCPGLLEQLPVTDEVKTIGLDLDSDTEAVGLPSWTISFVMPSLGLIQCGEMGIGDRVRFTFPKDEGVWRLGATPAYDSLHVSNQDTVHEMQAVYTYSPSP